jgi:hypothetical protein
MWVETGSKELLEGVGRATLCADVFSGRDGEKGEGVGHTPWKDAISTGIKRRRPKRVFSKKPKWQKREGGVEGPRGAGWGGGSEFGGGWGGGCGRRERLEQVPVVVVGREGVQGMQGLKNFQDVQGLQGMGAELVSHRLEMWWDEVSLFVYLCLSVSLSLSVPLCLSLSLSFTLSLSIYIHTHEYIYPYT